MKLPMAIFVYFDSIGFDSIGWTVLLSHFRNSSERATIFEFKLERHRLTLKVLSVDEPLI